MSLLDSLSLTPTQREAAMARGHDVSLAAGAGSGKTRTLVARYLSLLDEGRLPRGVAAVTFTEKAAREMRNRIRAEVHAWLEGKCPAEDRARWGEIEADVDAARIGTIHGLCASILRAHPAEAGVDPRFDVLEEGLAAALRARAVEDSLAWAMEQTELVPLFEIFSTNDLDEILTRLLGARLEAQAAFDVPDLPRIWNSALRVAIARFVDDDRIQSAIGELRELKVSQALVADAGDKLAPQVEGLTAEWGTLERGLSDGKLMEAALALYTVRREYCGGAIGKKDSRAKAAVKKLRELYDDQVLPWLGGKSKDDPAPDPALEARLAELVRLLGRLFDHALAEYQGAKDQRQAIDFDDLEAGALALLAHPEIRVRWQRQIDALLVDEFQDTNQRQREIVEALAGVSDGSAGRLFVVGDAKQSIYRFRGADVSVFRDLERAIRARGGLYLSLALTFRAHDALVRALNELLGQIMGQGDDPASPYLVPFAELEADRKAPRSGILEPYIEFLVGLGETADQARPAEASLLARRLRELHEHEGVRWEDVALLFRASTGFPFYEAALESAGIPFVTVAGRGFYDRPEVRDLLNILRALADPWDDLALAGLLRSPAFGLGDAALYLLRWPDGRTEPHSFRAALAGDLVRLPESDRRQAVRAREIFDRLSGFVDRIPVAELLKEVIGHTLYPAVLASAPPGERLQRNVDKLLADAHASGLVRVVEFLEYIETLQAAGAREGEAPAEAGGAVRLMTVHKAKGLEFPVVVIADASRARPTVRESVLMSTEIGLVPYPGRQGQAPLIFRLAKQREKERAAAEEVRLLYVAATRAKEKLIICGYQTPRAGVWLNTLAGAAGLGLNQLAESPGEWRSLTLPNCGVKVAGLAMGRDGLEFGTKSEESASVVPLSDEEPLYRPLVPAEVEQVDEKVAGSENLASRAPRVTARRRHPDGTVVGKLVHEAIRRWRFPGDPGLDGLLRAAALETGEVDTAAMASAIGEARECLARFRSDPRWAEIAVAERRHEVPYSLSAAGRISAGFIDLIYRGEDGRWTIVDFKTDKVGDEADMQRLIEGGYGEQMRRYGKAVSKLLGRSPGTTLCFLDFAGGLRWEPIL